MKTPTLLILAVGLTLSLGWSSTARSATWQSIGPDGGTVKALAFAPSDSRIAYAGTLGGGVFRSGDGGSTWTAASSGLKRQEIFSLAVDPRDSRVVYAGTIEGLYETTSGGASWRLLPLASVEFPPVVMIVQIDPARPRVLYAVTSSGLFRSADGGSHWTERDASLPGQVSALDIDPDHPGTLYAGVSNASDDLPVIYKTTDGGGRWASLPAVRTLSTFAFARQRSTDTLYASTWDGTFASADGGATWAQVSGETFETLVVTPSGTLYGADGSGGIFRSADSGRTWSSLLPSFGFSLGEVASLALDASGDRLLAGTWARGVYWLDTGTTSWNVSRGLRATPITGLAVSPASPPLLFASTNGAGVFVSANGGTDFAAHNAGLPLIDGAEIDAFAMATHPRTPGALVIGLDFGGGTVAQTSDTAGHWSTEAPICLLPDSLAVAPPATLFVSSSFAFSPGYSCSDCTAKVSRDGGATFACLDGPHDVSAFLVDPLRPIVVYAAAGDAIWKSTDRGAHFTQVASGLGMTITVLAASPAAHQTLYAGGGEGVLKSTDGGAHWSPVGSGLTGVTAALAVDPSNPLLVYATSAFSTPDFAGYTVFVSRDGGASWSLLGSGFPATSFIPALALDPARHVLYAATEGNGLWALSVP